MKTIDIYANGPQMNFETIDDLKANSIIRKYLFDDHGFLENFYIFEDIDKRNPLNHRYRVGLFNHGKVASVETDTIDEMLSALVDLKVQIKRPITEMIEMTDALRHQKYKRCLAMMEFCYATENELETIMPHELTPKQLWYEHNAYWQKWAERWKKLAENFKD